MIPSGYTAAPVCARRLTDLELAGPGGRDATRLPRCGFPALIPASPVVVLSPYPSPQLLQWLAACPIVAPFVVADLEARSTTARKSDFFVSEHAPRIGSRYAGTLGHPIDSSLKSRRGLGRPAGLEAESKPPGEGSADFPGGRRKPNGIASSSTVIGHDRAGAENNPDADEAVVERIARRRRLAASPNAFRRSSIAVRDVLPAIGVPTLVLHRTGDPLPIEGARWTAGQIPGAAFVELPAMSTSLLWVTMSLSSTIEAFLSGVWARGDWEEPGACSTVLFTDIVGSTAKAAALVIAPGRSSSSEHHRRVGRDSPGFAAGRSTLPATGSLRVSTVPPGRSGATRDQRRHARDRRPDPGGIVSW